MLIGADRVAGSAASDPARAARDKEARADPYYATAQWVGSFLVVNTLFSAASFLAGHEATLVLQVQQAYHWTLAQSMYAWGPLGLASFVFSMVVIPGLMDRLNQSHVALCGICLALGGLAGVNWFDLREPVPSWWFVLCGACANGNNMVGAVLNSIVAQRLPSVEQVWISAASPLRRGDATPATPCRTRAGALCVWGGGGRRCVLARTERRGALTPPSQYGRCGCQRWWASHHNWAARSGP